MSETLTTESIVAEDVMQPRVSRAWRWVGVLVLAGISVLHAAVVIGWATRAIWWPVVSATGSAAVGQ